MPIVYMATNSVNGKQYIGATVHNLKKRSGDHINSAMSGKGFCHKFHHAIRKYGPDSFGWEVLSVFPSREDALIEEVRLIALHKPQYNITAGGRGLIGVPRTPIWRERISAAQKGRKLTPERIAKIKASHRPDTHYKPVVCLNDGKWFQSLKSAASFYGVTKSGVGAVLHGRQTHVGGYSFVFSGAELPLEERLSRLDALQNRRECERSRRKSGLRARPVVCLNTGRQFATAKDAAAFAGVAHSRISQLCSSGGATRRGLSFRYADSGVQE